MSKKFTEDYFDDIQDNFKQLYILIMTINFPGFGTMKHDRLKNLLYQLEDNIYNIKNNL